MNPREKNWKIVGINFDHMHMGDLLRQVHEHPSATIAGVCDDAWGAACHAQHEHGLGGAQMAS
mgnify:CR=1 FL=1